VSDGAWDWFESHFFCFFFNDFAAVDRVNKVLPAFQLVFCKEKKRVFASDAASLFVDEVNAVAVAIVRDAKVVFSFDDCSL